jgi:hypothetical protein
MKNEENRANSHLMAVNRTKSHLKNEVESRKSKGEGPKSKAGAIDELAARCRGTATPKANPAGRRISPAGRGCYIGFRRQLVGWGELKT